jgi:hypothetical protein
MNHQYDPSCKCDPCFMIWRAEAVVELAAARARGAQRRRDREALWAEMIRHFEGLIPDDEGPRSH